MLFGNCIKNYALKLAKLSLTVRGYGPVKSPVVVEQEEELVGVGGSKVLSRRPRRPGVDLAVAAGGLVGEQVQEDRAALGAAGQLEGIKKIKKDLILRESGVPHNLIQLKNPYVGSKLLIRSTYVIYGIYAISSKNESAAKYEKKIIGKKSSYLLYFLVFLTPTGSWPSCVRARRSKCPRAGPPAPASSPWRRAPRQSRTA